MKRKLIAGIDIGGTKIAVALGSPGGEMIFLERLPMLAESRSPYDIADDALQRLEWASGDAEIIAVGCGCPGPLDLERDLVMSPPNLSDWDESPSADN